jgi:hypothetical protein
MRDSTLAAIAAIAAIYAQRQAAMESAKRGEHRAVSMRAEKAERRETSSWQSLLFIVVISVIRRRTTCAGLLAGIVDMSTQVFGKCIVRSTKG